MARLSKAEKDAKAAEEATAAEEAKAAEEAAAAEEEKPKIGRPKKGPPVVYRVMKDWSGSLNGSMTKLSEGKRINPRHYGGEAALEQMRKAGVELELVEV